jgi:A/G-specific adenine glycosylase
VPVTTQAEKIPLPASIPPITQALLDWYDRNTRTLPWRVRGGLHPDPYRVWISEIMLQQTTVATVIPYYERFLNRWPAVTALAAAPLDDVLHGWQGLGYYSRARNLHRCAQVICETLGGQFPHTAAELARLPGIGPYTAAALASICFGEPVAAIDGNVQRVISRLYTLPDPPALNKNAVAERAAALVPVTRPGDFAQAVMDLGATVCTPKSPRCLLCPVQACCQAARTGTPELWPHKVAKATVPQKYGTVHWITRPDGAVWLRQRPQRGLLGGMMEVPSSDWTAAAPVAGFCGSPLFPADWQPVPGVVKHVFTHFRLELRVVWCVRTDPPPLAGRWVLREQLANEALPTLMHKVIALAGMH